VNVANLRSRVFHILEVEEGDAGVERFVNVALGIGLFALPALRRRDRAVAGGRRQRVRALRDASARIRCIACVS
jgi:hypothetical protein